MKSPYVFLKNNNDYTTKDFHTAMLGAVTGDVAGSIYEHHNIKYCLKQDELINERSRFTDDTVMTCAIAEGISNGLKQLPYEWLTSAEHETVICNEIIKSMVYYGNKYPYAGYGGRFTRWLAANGHADSNSFGNGSAMRASYAGWIARSLLEAERLAELSAKVSHGHPEGIKGAMAVAGSIYLLLETQNKEEVRKYVGKMYDINFSLDDIRESYRFDVTCQGSVPQAIVAFLEGTDFADVISKAIYDIPDDLQTAVVAKLNDNLIDCLARSVEFMNDYKC